MAEVDPGWSLDAVLRDYNPHESWRDWFSEAYTKAMDSPHPRMRLDGWKAAAIIFGDMHAPVFCLFVCHHGRSLVPADSPAFLGHIDLCLWELGLATPARPTEHGTVPSGDVGHPDGFNRDAAGAEAWLAEQLRPFGGRVDRAAAFAMRLTAARFGLISGPAKPSVAQVLDASLWAHGGRKAWWRFW